MTDNEIIAEYWAKIRANTWCERLIRHRAEEKRIAEAVETDPAVIKLLAQQDHLSATNAGYERQIASLTESIARNKVMIEQRELALARHYETVYAGQIKASFDVNRIGEISPLLMGIPDEEPKKIEDESVEKS